MSFFNQDPTEQNEPPPSPSLTRSQGISDLQKLMASVKSNVSIQFLNDDDDDDEVEINIVDDEESDEHFSLAPVPPTSPEPAPVSTATPYAIKQLTFESAAGFVQKMEHFLSQSLDMSMGKTNELSLFLHRPENSTYFSKWEMLFKGMGEFLSTTPTKEFKVPQFETFLHAFRHFKATQGFSMGCYLKVHNENLGKYLLANEAAFNDINQAFKQAVKADPKKKF